MNQSDCLLYLVTNSDHLAREPFLRVIEEALQNGVTLLQLREKDKDGREFYEEALAVKELSKRYHVPLLIDDRIDVALAVDADGVHVGQSDLPVSVARKLLGPGKIVGATAKTVAQALEAQEQGADYLGTGAIFPTQTKAAAIPTSVGTLSEVCRAVHHPGCGHWRAQTGQLVRAGGMPDQRVAVVSAIMSSATPGIAARELAAMAKKLVELGRAKTLNAEKRATNTDL